MTAVLQMLLSVPEQLPLLAVEAAAGVGLPQQFGQVLQWVVIGAAAVQLSPGLRQPIAVRKEGTLVDAMARA